MMYWREISVNWGESDPFGLVYYPRMLAWFNDTEHELFRTLGYPIDKMIQNDRTTFVMGEIHFRFIGPAAYGDRVTLKLVLTEIKTIPHAFSWSATMGSSANEFEIGDGDIAEPTLAWRSRTPT